MFHMQKIKPLGTSLVVQCLTLCLPMQGVQFQFLVMKLRSYMPHAAKTPKHKQQKKYCKNSIKDLKKKVNPLKEHWLAQKKFFSHFLPSRPDPA